MYHNIEAQNLNTSQEITANQLVSLKSALSVNLNRIKADDDKSRTVLNLLLISVNKYYQESQPDLMNLMIAIMCTYNRYSIDYSESEMILIKDQLDQIFASKVYRAKRMQSIILLVVYFVLTVVPCFIGSDSYTYKDFLACLSSQLFITLHTMGIFNDYKVLWLVTVSSLLLAMFQFIHFLNLGIAFLIVEYRDKDVEQSVKIPVACGVVLSFLKYCLMRNNE